MSRTDDLPGFLRMIRQMVEEEAPASQITAYLGEAAAEFQSHADFPPRVTGAKPFAWYYFEARTGGGYSQIPRIYTHRDAVIPACHKGPFPLYAHPPGELDA